MNAIHMDLDHLLRVAPEVCCGGIVRLCSHPVYRLHDVIGLLLRVSSCLRAPFEGSPGPEIWNTASVHVGQIRNRRQTMALAERAYRAAAAHGEGGCAAALCLALPGGDGPAPLSNAADFSGCVWSSGGECNNLDLLILSQCIPRRSAAVLRESVLLYSDGRIEIVERSDGVTDAERARVN